MTAHVGRWLLCEVGMHVTFLTAKLNEFAKIKINLASLKEPIKELTLCLLCKVAFHQLYILMTDIHLLILPCLRCLKTILAIIQLHSAGQQNSKILDSFLI